MGDRVAADDRDFRDAVGLVRSLGLSAPTEVLAVVSRYFPGQALPPLAESRLPEVLAAATERPG